LIPKKKKEKLTKEKPQLFFWPANITGGLIPKKKKKNSQKKILVPVSEAS